MPRDIQARPKQGDIRGRLWERVTKSDDRLVEGERKVQSLASNAEALRLLLKPLKKTANRVHRLR